MNRTAALFWMYTGFATYGILPGWFVASVPLATVPLRRLWCVFSTWVSLTALLVTASNWAAENCGVSPKSQAMQTRFLLLWWTAMFAAALVRRLTWNNKKAKQNG